RTAVFLTLSPCYLQRIGWAASFKGGHSFSMPSSSIFFTSSSVISYCWLTCWRDSATLVPMSCVVTSRWNNSCRCCNVKRLERIVDPPLLVGEVRRAASRRRHYGGRAGDRTSFIACNPLVTACRSREGTSRCECKSADIRRCGCSRFY